MLTPASRVRQAPAVPAYRPFAATVVRILPMSPHLVRVTFASDDFCDFGTTGLDQRVKLIIPLPDGRMCDVGANDPNTIADGTWHQRWRAVPHNERNPLRTYTVRAIRPNERELDVDMVRHPVTGTDEGPAAAWIRRMGVGDSVVIIGPDARTSDPMVGCDWRPGAARHLLLVGDETAAPAICSVMESLSPSVSAQAFIEVPTSDDILSVYPGGRSRMAWLARDGGCETASGRIDIAPHGALLTAAVMAWLDRHTDAVASVLRPIPDPVDDINIDVELLWDSPVNPSAGDFYAWVAGEAAMVKAMRHHLVTTVGVARSNVAFMGYWRAGRAEAS